MKKCKKKLKKKKPCVVLVGFVHETLLKDRTDSVQNPHGGRIGFPRAAIGPKGCGRGKTPCQSLTAAVYFWRANGHFAAIISIAGCLLPTALLATVGDECLFTSGADAVDAWFGFLQVFAV